MAPPGLLLVACQDQVVSREDCDRSASEEGQSSVVKSGDLYALGSCCFPSPETL